MKKTLVCFALMGLVALGGPAAFAELCTIDDVPAATLLLPYFEVDLSNPNGRTTLFSVNNASAAPALAHVTVWSNASIPIFDFDIYLTGYDVQTINLFEVLTTGNLPQTGFNAPTATELPGSAPEGDFSLTNVNFPNCGAAEGNAPWYSRPAISPGFLAHIQASLLGDASPSDGLCRALPIEDNLAVGYITIDNSTRCNLDFPSDNGYFGAGGGTGNASNQNVLWGDYIYADTGNNFAQGETLVHIEAADGFVGGPNQYTFYGRYTQDEGFADNREPLATNFATRFAAGEFAPGFPGGTDLIVWRDSADPGAGEGASSPFTCGTAPGWFPLRSNQIVVFDEEENPVTPEDEEVSGIPPGEQQNPFPLETQRVPINVTSGDGLLVPAGWEFGWVYLNLNLPLPGEVWPGAPDRDIQSAQAWVTAVSSADGRFSIGTDAVQLDSACAPFTGQIGADGIIGPTSGAPLDADGI